MTTACETSGTNRAIEKLHLAVAGQKDISGFVSRWVTPFACAAARPSAIAIPISAALRHDSAPRSKGPRRFLT